MGGLAGYFVVGAAIAGEILAAIETAQVTHADDARTAAQRKADAAGSVFAFFNANHERAGTPRHRPHVELIAHTYPEPEDAIRAATSPGLDAQRLFEAVHATACLTTLAGALLPDWVAESYTCDCVIHRVLAAGTTVADYGRKTRTVPVHLFRRVALRDAGCRFPGCNRPVAWTDAHHIVHWRHGGATKEWNLLLLCGFHHRMVHRDSWDIVLHADATSRFTKADGTQLTSEPRGPCSRARAPVAV